MNRRRFLQWTGLSAAALAMRARGESGSGTILQFEDDLFKARQEKYGHPKIDIIKGGFRPVGGSVADFGAAEHAGRVHFFYIERRLTEGTPFYPGHEIFFGHASTGNLFDWQVHEPVMLIRPGTWEEEHVWAPCLARRGDEYIMAYTGINRYISQNIGIATSRDMFEWKRWDSNPISPCKDRPWAAWREDHISSCRDPGLFEHEGRWYMNYTANTKEGATCIALTSTADFKTWKDHGPVCIGPASGYEMRINGGHLQGSMESTNIIHRNGRWHLLVNAKVRDNDYHGCWIVSSDSFEHFDFATRREFWAEGAGIECIRRRGDRELLATFADGVIRFGTVNWADDKPTGRLMASADELHEWNA